MDKIKSFWTFLPQKYKRKTIITVFLSLIGAAAETVGVAIIVPLMLIILNYERVIQNEYYVYLNQFLHIDTQVELVIIFSILIVVVYLLKNVFSIFFTYFKQKYYGHIFFYCSNVLFKKYIHKDYTFHASMNKSLILRKIIAQGREFSNVYLTNIINLTSHSLIILGLFSFMLYVDWLSTLLIIGVVGMVSTLYFKYSNKVVKRKVSSFNNGLDRLNVTLMEAFLNIKNTKIRKKEDYFGDTFKEASKAVVNIEAVLLTLSQSTRFVIEFIFVLVILTSILIFVINSNSTQSIIINLSVFATTAFRLYPSINALSQSIVSIRTYSRILEKYTQEFEEKIEISPSIGKRSAFFEEKITLENVDFDYPSKKDILRDINLEIHKNTSIAFVGRSGSGKTTLVDAISALVNPQSGQVKLDGVSISEFYDYQLLFSYIAQDGHLSDTTIEQNVAFGITPDNIDRERVIECLKTADIYDFVMEHPDGVETQIGDDGIMLSGGQRQRLCIARSLYDDAQIMIMDEATAALDNITEAKIISTIDKIAGEKTLIFIAHRLSTIKNCDVIYVMDKGKIVAEGTYEQLEAESPIFQSMLKENNKKPKKKKGLTE